MASGGEGLINTKTKEVTMNFKAILEWFFKKAFIAFKIFKKTFRAFKLPIWLSRDVLIAFLASIYGGIISGMTVLWYGTVGGDLLIKLPKWALTIVWLGTLIIGTLCFSFYAWLIHKMKYDS